MIKRVLKNPTAFCCALFLLLLIGGVSLGPLLMDHDPISHSLAEAYQPPSADHVFGTDKFGRDLCARTLQGGRISLAVAFLAALLAMVIGIPYGLISGYLGGKVDAAANWVLNVFMAFPQFFLLLAVVALLGTHHFTWVIFIIGFLSWMNIARIVRNMTFSIKEREFIQAEKVVGISKRRLLWRHITPNLVPSVIVAFTLMIGDVILIESALSFLGLGVQPPMPSWGNIINEGRQVLIDAWWISLFPGLAILLTVFCVNLLGERLQQVMISRDGAEC